ncbi:lipid-A-disaccharide synthase [Wielerella bovis]|uniref:lipid-A-disaccharide synthase n=1 Tax=Wielerella bovis TaxID=2917790 RepID=UPI00201938AA|nr:lipid-A-disaccharide synthase [Wielerella bovis]ULJ62599.1 lipid-A-disaccharide synthase [Wielerella bovis]
MSTQSLTIALCAGEASGDLLGAHLIEAIKAQRPDAKFIGIGGPRMIAAGCESLFDQERLAVRGYVEVIKRLPEILKIRRELVEKLKQIRPNVFIGIDAPDFNLGVAEQLKAARIPTLHYVSPSVWAWKRERVNKIVKQVNQVLCLFPMEAPLYQAAGGRALFIGHPLAQTLPMIADKAVARERLKLDTDIPVFAILAGSRVSEIDYMAPIFFRTAQLILRELPNAQFISPYATAASRERLQHYLSQPEFEKLPIRLQAAKADLACTAADVVLVTSGTATLEVALCKRPMVISYKISPLTYFLVKRKIQVPHVGLPNILLNKEVVPELLQHDATPEKLAAAMLDWYRQPEKIAQVEQEFVALHEMLKLDTDKLAADAVLAEAR